MTTPSLCQGVHGGLRFIHPEHIPFLGAEAMREVLDMIVRCAQLVLMEFGIFGTTVRATFDKCRTDRALMTATVLRHHDPTFGARVLGIANAAATPSVT